MRRTATRRRAGRAGGRGRVGADRLDAACCYFSAKDKDILQPAQKVFITWDPVEKVETFTVQPKFEGNALDFGMVIPTPGQAEAGRDAARLLQGARRLHHPQEARVPRSRSCCRRPATALRRSAGARRVRRPADGTKSHGQGARSRRRRLAGLQDHQRRAGRRPVHLAEGQQVQLLRRRGDARLLHQEEVALHRHEDRHHADEDATRTAPSPARSRRRASSSPSEQARLPAEDHADLGEGQDRGPVLRAGPAQGRSAGRHDLPVHLHADVVAGDRASPSRRS